MRKMTISSFPAIAVEERPEKLNLVVPPALKSAIAQFGDFFAASTAQVPLSFNAIVAGILAGYLKAHGPYQRWRKTRGRTEISNSGVLR